MISAHIADALAGVAPLSHRAYTAFTVNRALEKGLVAPVHVQIRRQGVTLCGQIAEMVEDFNDQGKDWFKVDCGLGRVWCEAKNIRLCAAEGRNCSCEAPF